MHFNCLDTFFGWHLSGNCQPKAHANRLTPKYVLILDFQILRSSLRKPEHNDHGLCGRNVWSPQKSISDKNYGAIRFLPGGRPSRSKRCVSPATARVATVTRLDTRKRSWPRQHPLRHTLCNRVTSRYRRLTLLIEVRKDNRKKLLGSNEESLDPDRTVLCRDFVRFCSHRNRFRPVHERESRPPAALQLFARSPLIFVHVVLRPSRGDRRLVDATPVTMGEFWTAQLPRWARLGYHPFGTLRFTAIRHSCCTRWLGPLLYLKALLPPLKALLPPFKALLPSPTTRPKFVWLLFSPEDRVKPTTPSCNFVCVGHNHSNRSRLTLFMTAAF